ncbi:MAG TPA: YeeE/YedE thiosulfate transporter family protein [Agriterribacter sp.]|nr:YeeE/YedE family protein [Chitinophagaceae bacterium]HRP34139.1 YeeE/YedE thiosulfate transporter family protein [Agriterribacter sp.]
MLVKEKKAEIPVIKIDLGNTDYEVRSQNAMCVNESTLDKPLRVNFKYALMGVFFGVLLVKAEVVSWFRIQEMFKLQSFHMYGVIGSAVLVGMISVALIKKLKAKSIEKEDIHLEAKPFHKGQVFGGLIFGLGWAITGACPGPLYALIGTGATVIIVTLFSAIVGTWVYGRFRHKLPH